MSMTSQTPGAANVNASEAPSIPNIEQAEIVNNYTSLTISLNSIDLCTGAETPINPTVTPGETFTIQIGSTAEYAIEFELNSDESISLVSSGWSVESETATTITVTNSTVKHDSIANVSAGGKNTKGLSSSCEIIIVGTVPIGDE